MFLSSHGWQLERRSFCVKGRIYLKRNSTMKESPASNLYLERNSPQIAEVFGGTSSQLLGYWKHTLKQWTLKNISLALAWKGLSPVFQDTVNHSKYITSVIQINKTSFWHIVLREGLALQLVLVLHIISRSMCAFTLRVCVCVCICWTYAGGGHIESVKRKS